MKLTAGSGVTLTVATPVMLAVTVSSAVIVWVPTVLRITPVNVCVPMSPAVNVKSAGSTATPSVDVKRTVPYNQSQCHLSNLSQ